MKNYFYLLISFALIFQSCDTNEINENDNTSLKKTELDDQAYNRSDTITEAELLTELNRHFNIINKKDIKSNSATRTQLGITNSFKLIELTYNNQSDKLYINFLQNDSFNVYYTEDVNGQLAIYEGLKFQTINDKPILIGELSISVDSTGRKDFQWCQREGDETSSECEDREYDEFTDDAVGFIAYWSNPWIAILIAAECRC